MQKVRLRGNWILSDAPSIKTREYIALLAESVGLPLSPSIRDSYAEYVKYFPYLFHETGDKTIEGTGNQMRAWMKSHQIITSLELIELLKKEIENGIRKQLDNP